MQILELLDTMGLVNDVSRRTKDPGDNKMAARKDASGTTPKRRRLGRGLTSLISTEVPIPSEESSASETPAGPPPSTATTEVSRDAPVVTIIRPDGDDDEQAAIRPIPTSEIRPNPSQPRQRFDEASLRELGASMRSMGVMQPVAVRPHAGGFELVVGERRWRAAQLVGISHLPAVVREMDDETAAEWALVENIQREDLDPLERANAFRRLSDQFGLTHQEIADRVGLSRSAVTNQLRLLDLDELSRDLLAQRLLTEGHARALLAITNLDSRKHLAQMAVRKEWSVRTLESRAATLSATPRRSATSTGAAPPHRADLERKLSDHLGTKVQLKPGKQKGSGRLVIEFYSFDQFEGLMQKLGFSTAEL
ncbi:MAG: ParB/RepB/Spo0J family partition protein [Planctomycetota bacterium]|jgi:ParB family chromosome partitioning protein